MSLRELVRNVFRTLFPRVPETVPVSLVELGAIDELYVVVFNAEKVERLKSNLAKRVPLQPDAHFAHFAGMVYEVVSRQPHAVDAYLLGGLASVTNAHRQQVGGEFACSHIAHDFLFTVKEITLGAGIPIIYKGDLVRYDFENGTPVKDVQPEPVTLTLATIPHSKQRTVLHTSCGIVNFAGSPSASAYSSACK